MDYKAALVALKKLDGGAELASVFEAEFDALSSKNYLVIGEKRTETQKKQAYETALVAIAKSVGVEGEIDDILANTESKVKAIASEAAQLKTDKTALETRATEAEGKLKGFERKAKFAELATAAGANAAVLEKLLGDRFEELKIEGEGDSRVVKLGDKTLKEAVSADESLKLFEAALFPAAVSTQGSASSTKPPEQKQSAAPKLPNGSPRGNAEEKQDVLSAYFAKSYGGAKALTNQKAAGS